MSKKMTVILDLAEKLSREQKASLAGMLMNEVGINESTVTKFLEPIGWDSWADLADHIREARPEEH